MTTIEPMTLVDIPQVLVIDRLSFPLPWSEISYKKELTENTNAHFFVAVDGERTGWAQGRGGRRGRGRPPQRRVIGFVGYWHIVDEAHISTIAVHPRRCRRGAGEELL